MRQTIVSAAFALIACTLAAPAQGQDEEPQPTCQFANYWWFADCYITEVQEPYTECDLSKGGLGYTAFCRAQDVPSFLIPHCFGDLPEEYEVLVCIKEYLDGGGECKVGAVRVDESLVGYAAQCETEDEGGPDDGEEPVNEENVYGVGSSRITAHSKTAPAHPAGRGLPLR